MLVIQVLIEESFILWLNESSSLHMPTLNEIGLGLRFNLISTCHCIGKS